MLLLLLILAGPCDTLATSPMVRTVQRSEAFARAVRAMPDTSAAARQALCENLTVSPDGLPSGASFVSGLAAQAFEPIYATFAVRGDSVWLLNPIRDHRLHAGLDIVQWNAAVGGRHRIASDSAARYYARGIAALHTNWGPRPHPFCGRDSMTVAQPEVDRFRVVDLLLLVTVAFRTDATVDVVEDFNCEGRPRSPG